MTINHAGFRYLAIAKKKIMQDIKEIWKDIPGFEGFYQASTLGQIRRVNTIVNHPKGGKSKKKGKLIKQKRSKAGYMNITLCCRGVKTTKTVHGLIARTFIENPGNLPQVNHKDGNKSNSQFCNLEWVSGSGNMIHAINLGLIKRLPPEKFLNESKLNTIINLKRIGYNQQDLARIFRISASNVSDIVRRKKCYAKSIKQI